MAMAMLDIVLLATTSLPIWLYECIFLFAFLIYILWLTLGLLNYNPKYFLLGGEYKRQLKHLEYLRKFIPFNYSYLTPRKAKKNYRRYGDILKPLSSINEITPINISYAVTSGVDQNNDKEWKTYLLFSLYQSIVCGGGLDRFFEDIARYYDISFAELKTDFKGMPELPDDLKKLLTGTRAKKTLDYNKRFTSLSEGEFDDMCKLETNYSHLANKFESELLSAVEKISMEKYKFIYMLYGIEETAKRVYINGEKDTRYSIWFDKKQNAYRITASEFLPLYPDNRPIYNVYSWQSLEDYGLYATKELAENEIADKVEGFEVIDIDSTTQESHQTK